MTIAAQQATLPDESVRRRIRECLDVNFLVEAGAGTGKTTLLLDRLEALIRTGRARLKNVVAITFTEKAAAELRQELRDRIEKRLRESTGVERDLFMQAREDLEIAPVSTIHAFAASLIRERPVEAGVDPGFRVVDELEASLFRREAWDRWLERQRDRPDPALREAIEYGLALGQIREAANALLRFRDVLTEGLDRGSRPQDPLEWLRERAAEIEGLVARCGSDCRDPSDNAVRDLEARQRSLSLLATLPPAEARGEVLGSLKLKIGGDQRKWRPGTLGLIKTQLERMDDELDALRLAHGHWLAAGLFSWLRGYVAEYQDLKSREGALDFDDLLLKARDLLRDDGAAREAFQRRFEAILVDEFQDTDPLQAETIFFLAGDPDAGARAGSWNEVVLRPGKLFLVGDPKQSIYSFRRADIETYEVAKEALERGGEVEHIVANFRSVAEILNGVNARFQGVMRRPSSGAYQPDYVALEPSPRTRSAGASCALVRLYQEDAAGASVPELRRREAEGLAAFLCHAVGTGMWRIGPKGCPAGFGDIVLLFRGLADVPLYEEALARYHIPYRVTSSRTFYQREEIGWLLNVLHAVEHPTDPVAVWGALRSPFFGCSDREMYQFVTGGGSLDYRQRSPSGLDTAPAGVETARAILRELHERRVSLSVAGLVEEVLHRTHALETFAVTHQGEQRVANLLKVVTLARALEESGILTFRAFVHWLRDMEKQAVDEAESTTMEEGDDFVRIMSIHAAKGLQFPVVVLADLGRGRGAGETRLIVDRVGHAFGMCFGKVGCWFVQTREYEPLKSGQKLRDAAERLRLLYVAMTRAQDALVVAVFPKTPDDTLMLDLAVPRRDGATFGTVQDGWLAVDGAAIPKLDADGPALRLAIPAIFAGAVGETAAQEDGSPGADTVMAERSRWLEERESGMRAAAIADSVVTPSSLVDQGALAALKQAGAQVAARGGRRLGDLVHVVLAALPLNRPDLIEPFVRYYGARLGAPDALMSRASDLVRAALNAESVLEAAARLPWREVPFAAVENGSIVEGAIDLVFEHGLALEIVDFKTDQLVAGKGAEVGAVLESLYRPQLDSYVTVARRAGWEQVRARLLPLHPAEHQPPGSDKPLGSA
jgi:ATP-dependent helicase/nuclease subunit A